jgi:hypothetical protein
MRISYLLIIYIMLNRTLDVYQNLCMILFASSHPTLSIVWRLSDWSARIPVIQISFPAKARLKVQLFLLGKLFSKRS